MERRGVRCILVPLHWTETALRNAVHARLVGHVGRDDWWHSKVLDHNGHRQVDDARSAVRRLGRDPEVSDSVVAELNFGFWVSLLGKRYSRKLWVPAPYRVFPGRSRREVHDDFDHVRRLRNRISHGEPIHHRHLEADHATIRRLLRDLSPDALREATHGDRVPALLSRRQAP